MSALGDVFTGLGVYLDGQGVANWNPTGVAVDGDLVRGALPAELTTGIGMQGYRIGQDDPANPTTQLRVQFMLRAPDFATLDDMDAALDAALQGLTGLALGAATLTQALSISSLPLGVDGNGNYERACNYRLDLDMPATPLRSY